MRPSGDMGRYLRLGAAVAEALAAGRPVVALESTVIAHGLPRPANVAVALARGATAATTVAGTLACGALAGVRVFATGGIGGVHRGAEATLDISADLPELARAELVTICAGAKSILDLPRTLEYLETLGVPVFGYQTDELPAFYTRESGLRVPYRVESAAEVAALARAQWASGLGGGLLVVAPIPQEHALPRAQVEAAVERALDEARAADVRGPRLTLWLLARVAELTGGESVAANRALLLNNARIAAHIAVALSSSPTD